MTWRAEFFRPGTEIYAGFGESFAERAAVVPMRVAIYEYNALALIHDRRILGSLPEYDTINIGITNTSFG